MIAAAFAERLGAALDRERAGQSLGEAAGIIKARVAERRKAATLEFARGDAAAKRLAADVDEVLAILWDHGAKRHGAATPLALAAVGGYGRGLLAPYSDIDLVFLHGGAAEGARPLVDFMLYALWDAGLKVGHAVHTPASAVSFGKKNHVAATAYLDRRRLFGSAPVYRDFSRRYEALRLTSKKQFLTGKLLERDRRHERSEQSRFLAEPDLKEGKGGLRDLQTIRWIYKYEFGRDIDDPKAPKMILAPEDVKAFQRCERFLWSVRVQLHGLCGRAEERLAFDVQPALAARLGYADRGFMPAAERLMKHYFVNALEVGRLTRIFTAKLEAERVLLAPPALNRMPKSLLADEAGDGANLKLVGRRLHFSDLRRARRNPAEFFRLFRAYSRRSDFDFHPDALAAIAASAPAIDSKVRGDPVVARLFMSALTEAKDPDKMLRVMAETGLLGKYIPSFGRIVGRIEYGLYRRFSIDESVYRSIGVLREIADGRAASEHPLATKIVAAQKSLNAYFAAALLRETAWSLRERSAQASEGLVAAVMRRLGVAAEDIPIAAWSAAHFELMARIAERRNLAEPEAIAQFARTVGDRRRLDLLLVLAICHLRVVGRHSWDAAMKRRLTELYEGAVAWLDGGDEALARHMARRAAETRAAAARLLSEWQAGERDAFLSLLTPAVYRSVEPEMIARIADLVRAAEAEGAREAVVARLCDGDIEAIVYAADRKGLLADLAGAVAASGASVRAVQAMTAEGRAIDIFAIESLDGAPIEDAEALRRLHANLLNAARAAPRLPHAFARRLGDRRLLFSVPPIVRLDPEASRDCLLVEAEGRDRPGLLYELARALSELGLTIASAHIATYGARAVDAFYVTGGDGRPVEGRERFGAIEDRLLDVLGDGAAQRSVVTAKP